MSGVPTVTDITEATQEEYGESRKSLTPHQSINSTKQGDQEKQRTQ